MSYLFLEYPKCSTCQKAKAWLDSHNIVYEDRHIVENRPTAIELKEWIKRSGQPLKRIYNTCALLYNSLVLKEKLPVMSEDDQIALLATNGMLVKRPLVVGENFVLTGFKPDMWASVLFN